MTRDEQPEDNTLALIDAVKDWAEGLAGMVAVLRDDGWNDEQARTLVVHLVTKDERDEDERDGAGG